MAESLVELATRDGQNIIAQAITQSSIVVTNAKRAEEAADRAEEAMSRAQSAGSSSEAAKREAAESAEQATLIYNSFLQQYGYPFTAATAAAMTDTSKIYVYVGSETGYVNGNWYYNNGTAWVSGGVYNSTALETDTTLTVSGAAADAKVTGRTIKGLAYNNVFNFLEGLYGESVDAGITYTINGDGSCTVSGTATSQSFKRVWDNGNTFPLGMYAGQTLYVDYTATNVSLQIWKRKNNQLSSLYTIFAPRTITIPADSDGIYIRLAVSSGVTVSNETVKPQCYTVDGEALRGVLCNVGVGTLGYTDANNIDKNHIVFVSNGNVSNTPYTYGWLITLLSGTNNKIRLQIMYPYDYPNNYNFTVMMRRLNQSVSNTWTDWTRIDNYSVKTLGDSRNQIESCDDVTTTGIYFISTDGDGVSYVPDFPLNVGWLQTIIQGNWLFQLAYPWRTNDNIMFRIKNSSGWTDWKTVGNNITNNYVTNHYTNTYNVTANPTITADTNNYLASTGDATDRTADIQAILSSTGVCHLGTGDFYVSGVDVPVGATLDGCGNATKIHLLDSVADGYAVKLNENSTLKDVMLIGSVSDIALSETVGTRHGILWEGNANGDNNSIPYRGTISNIFIKGFNGGGITCYNTGYSTSSGINVENCHITNCNAGINISYWSEFSRFTNVNATGNYYGCINNGGNNMFVNCNFSSNKLAMLMDNSQGQSPNNTHGSAIGCVFNHTDGNSGIGIKILNCPSGFVFDGCQIFFSQIYLEDTDGITVANCTFGLNNCSITIKNGGAVLFNGNMHQGQPTISITNNNKVHFVNCYVRTTGAEVTA